MFTRATNWLRSLILRSVLWDAAGGGNRLARWGAPASGPATYHDNPIQLRARAEDQYRNNPWARKAVNAIRDAAWGASAINPMFANKVTQEAWKRWESSCDAAGRLDWCSLGAMVVQTVIVSGEAFIVLSLDPNAKGHPLRLTVLGPEFLDTSRVDGDTYGIRYDGAREAGYWLFPRHPGLQPMASFESVFVPVENCLRIARDIAPGAQHGQSWLAPVLLPLRELNEYLESALVKAKVAALFAGFVRTPDGSNPMLNSDGVPVLEPGSMTRLRPSEEVEFSNPPDVGISFDPFVRAQLRRIASGLSIPYEILSGDLSAVTFASGRHGLLEYRRTMESIQYGLMVPQFCAPVMRRWLAIAAALEMIPAEEPIRWIAPNLEMLDPRVETLAQIQRVRAGFTSRTEIVAAAGWRVEDIDSEIAADNSRADGLGLVLDSDPRKTTLQGQEQPEQQGGQAA
ncbi:MAG: phage portal protein [Acidobacteria bacterium]|nr:phage portal protein [Acidobacteriota bacterium]